MGQFQKGVVVVAKGYPPDLGGVQTYSQKISLALRSSGLRCLVVTSRPGRNGVLRERGVAVINIGQGSQFVVGLKMYCILRRLRKHGVVKRDLTWATTWRVAVPLLALRWPFWLTVHGREVRDDRNGVLRWPMHWVMRAATNIISISQYSYETFIPNEYRAKSQWAWEGASAWAVRQASDRRVAPEDSSHLHPINILFAARMVASKNLLGSIRGFARFIHSGGLGELRIAGNGPEFAAAEALVRAERLQQHVAFLGHLDARSLATAYRQADVFLHPQVEIETFGLSIADAMAAGLAVIAGCDGAPREYLTPGSGVIVDGRDPIAIASSLTELFANPHKRLRLGVSAASFASQNFRWDNHVRPIVEGLSHSAN